MEQLVIYVHGKGGCAEESQHYKSVFNDSDIIGFDYKSNNPWDAMVEFAKFFDDLCKGYKSVIIVANSIGAYYSLLSFADKKIDKMFLISPVVDMEKLITDMMQWANVSEKRLREEKVISTAFGEDLSWEYLCFARKHKVWCSFETHIAYGEKDNLVCYETIKDFACKNNASLLVMQNGEHWFHTKEQMDFIDAWIKNVING